MSDASAPPPVGVEAHLHFTQTCREQYRDEIVAAGDGEVMCYGRVDEEGVVVELEVAARGTSDQAPAILARADGWDVAIHNHPSGDLRPSQPDMQVASLLGEQGLGFMIVSNDLERVYVVVPVRPRPSTRPVEGQEVDAFLGDEGPIAAELGEGYEPREGQVRMAREVAAAFSQDQIALLEAGTGTGKTFAYLAPAAMFAQRNVRRVVVSTATIHLQEQVVGKDAPLLGRALRRALPEAGPLKVAVVKGRGNYVSLRRAAEASQQEPVSFGSDAEQAEVARLIAWAQTTKTGDRGELSPPPSGDAWEHVTSTADNCLGSRCTRFAECHYYESRRAATRAQIVVVNHALLCADLAIKRDLGFNQAAVLPPFERVVIDEAHHLESIAGEHFGAQVTGLGLLRQLGRLKRKKDGRGILPGLLSRLSRAGLETPVRELDEDLLPLRDQTARHVEVAFDEAAIGLRRALPAAEAQARDAKLRLRAAHRELLEPLDEAARALGLLGARLQAWIERARALADGPTLGRVEPLLRDAEAVSRRLARGAEALGVVLGDDPELVRWAELRRSRGGGDLVKLRAVPLEVGPLLQQALFQPIKTAVLTSATLTIQGGFDYLAQRVGVAGLPLSRVRDASIPSPFDYSRQALLAIPADVPLPDEREYHDMVAEAIRRAVLCSRGSAFCLFTSYGALNQAHRRLTQELQAEGLVPLRQGEMSRRELLERFRSTPGAVLFGTDSFWEGVDVPGDRLVLVLIARLPFRVPSDPLQEARAEAIEARGGNAFSELQLPQAVLKLKQGFGRLIRTSQDRGAVAVLDRRLLTKRYGRLFLDSLPDVRVEAPPFEELVETLAPFVRR
jgi:ATP-dependent DNA helicase DinG